MAFVTEKLIDLLQKICYSFSLFCGATKESALSADQ